MGKINGGSINFDVNMTVQKNGLNEIIQPLRQVQNQLNSISSNDGMRQNFEEAANAAKQLESIINSSWNDKLGQLNLDKFNQSLKQGNMSVQSLKKSLSGGAQAGQLAFNKLATQVLNTNVQLRQSNKLLDDMATSMANTVKWGITSSIFNTITSSIQSSYYYAKDLDRSLTDIRIVTGDSADQMERFARVANDAAKDLGRSTLDYTKAALSFYQQGLSDQEVQTRTEVTLKAQNITGAGSEMADKLTAVLNGFKVNVDQTELYVDKLAAVADTSASNMNELATAISKTASAANNMGVDIDQLNAQIATVIATTRQAPQSVGTAFKTIYARINDIQAGTEEAQISLGNYSGKMKGLGFDVLDTTGHLRDTGEVIEQIGSRWQELTKEQQINLAQTMAGQRQYNNLISLFDNWDTYLKEVNVSLNAQGTLNEKNSRYLESLQAHLQKLGTEAQRTYDILFDESAMKGMVDGLTGVLNTFNDFIDGLGGGITVFTYFGSLVAGIFNKQIAQGIIGVEQQFNRFMANMNILQAKANMIKAIKQDLQIKNAGQGNVLGDNALQKQAEAAEKTLTVQKGLTVEQQKQAVEIQKQIGLTQQKIDDLEKENQIAREKQKSLREQLSLQNASIERIQNKKQLQQQNYNFTSKNLKLLDEIQWRLEQTNSWNNKINLSQQERNAMAQKIKKAESDILNIANQTNVSEQKIVYAVKQVKEGLQKGNTSTKKFQASWALIENTIRQVNDDNSKTLQKTQELLKNIGIDTSKLTEEEKVRLSVLLRQNDALEQQGKHVISVQNVVKAMSAGGQILSSLAGAAKVFGDQMSTAQQKANATFSTIQGSVSAIGTMFGPIGMGISGLVNGVISLIKEVTPLGKIFENAFKTTDEKIQEINQHFKQTRELTASYASNKEKIKQLSDEFQNLARKKQRNQDLTQEEETRYHELVDAITEFNDGAIEGYDLKGQKIIDNNKLIQQTNELLDKQYEKQMRNAYGTGEVRKQYLLKNDQAKKRLEDLERQQQEAASNIPSMDDFLQDKAWGVHSRGFSKAEELNRQDEYWDAHDAFVNALGDFQIDNDIENLISAVKTYQTTLKDIFGEEDDFGLIDKLNAYIPQDLTPQIEAAQKDLEEAFKDFSIGDILNDLEWNSQNSQAFDELKETWGENYEKFGQQMTENLLRNFLSGLENDKNAPGDISNPQAYYDWFIEQGQEFISHLTAVDAKTLEQAEKELNDLVKDSGKITVSEYNERFEEILNSLVNNEQIQKLLEDSETKSVGIKILEAVFGMDPGTLKLAEDNTVKEYDNYIKSTLQRLRENGQIIFNPSTQLLSFGDFGTVTPTAMPQNFPNLQKEQEQEWNDLVNSLVNSKEYTQQQVNEFLVFLEESKQEISTDTFAAKLKEYFDDKDLKQQSEKYLEHFEKITSALEKLRSGKGLRYKEKVNLMAELGLSAEQVQSADKIVEGLKEALKKLDLQGEDAQQNALKRAEILSVVYNDFDKISEAVKKGELTDQDEISGLWNDVFNERLELLGITEEELEKFAKANENAFNTDDLKEQALASYEALEKNRQVARAQVKIAQEVAEAKKVEAEERKKATEQIEKQAKAKRDAAYEDAINAAKQKEINATNAQNVLDRWNSREAGQSTIDLSEEQAGSLLYFSQTYDTLKDLKIGSQEFYKQLEKILKIQNLVLESNISQRTIKKERQKELEDEKAKLEEQVSLLPHLTQEEQKRLRTGKFLTLEQEEAAETILQKNNQRIEKQQRIKQINEQQNRLAAESIVLENQTNQTIEQKVLSISELYDTYSKYKKILQQSGDLQGQDLKEFNETLNSLVETYPQLETASNVLKETWLAGTDGYKEALEEVEDYLERISQQEKLEQAFENLSDFIANLDDVKIKIDPSDFQNWADEVLDFLSVDRQITISVNSDIDDEFEEVKSRLEEIYNTAGKIGQNFVIAADDIRQVNNVFPGIIQGMQRLDDGSYQLNENMVQRAISTAQAQAGADTQALKEKIRNQIVLLQEKNKIYKNMLAAAKVLASHEKQTDKAVTVAREQLSKGLVDLKANNQQIMANNTKTNEKLVVDNNKTNTEIIAKNWAASSSDSLRSIYEMATKAIDYYNGIAMAAQEASQGRIFKISFNLPTINSNYSGNFGQTNEEKGLEGLINDVVLEDTIDTSKAEALVDAFGYLIDETGSSINNLYGELAQLGARTYDTAEGLNNVYQGRAIDDNGKTEESKDTSSSPKNSSNKSSSPKEPKEKQDKEKQTQKKDAQFIDYLTEEKDRYHYINNEIKNLSKNLDRIQKAQKQLYGKDLIKNLNEQLKILEKQIKANEVKLKIAKQEKRELVSQLRTSGVKIDKNGMITNYNDALTTKLNKVNETIYYYNTLTQEEQKEYKKTVDKVKKSYEEFKKKIENYEKLVTDTIPELQDQITEYRNEQVEIAISKFNMAIEIQLDLSQAERDWNNFKKKIIRGIRQDDIIENTKTTKQNFGTYYSNQIPEQTQHVLSLIQELQQMNNTGSSNNYGTNKQKLLEDLQKYNEKLMQSLENAQDLIEQVQKSFYNMTDAAQKAFDEQVKEYDFISSLIEHDKKLVQLLYGDEALDAIKIYNDKQIETDQRELDFQRRQKEFWWSRLQAEKQRLKNLDKESNAYKEAEKRLQELEQHWMNSVNDFNAAVEKSVEHLLEQYKNNIAIIFEDLQKKLTNGKGLDYIEEEWELINDNANMYLDKVNSIYEIQKLERSVAEALENSRDSTKAQQSLNNLMGQQLKILKDKDKLTKYDVDRANMLLQIEIKRLALQQSRNNKSKLRLRRDSQGNYTYQYTTDQDQMNKATQELLDAQNALYNLDKNQYTKNLNDILKAQTDFNSKLKALYEEYPVWTEQAERKRQLLISAYGERVNGLVHENEVIRRNFYQDTVDTLDTLEQNSYTIVSNSGEAINGVVQTNEQNRQNWYAQTFEALKGQYGDNTQSFKTMYQNMNEDQKQQFMEGIVPQWSNGVQDMADVIAGQEGLEPVCSEAIQKLDENTENYEEELGKVQDAAGLSFGQVKEGTDQSITNTETLVKDNQNLVTEYTNQYNALLDVIQAMQDLVKEYKNIKNAAIEATKAANDYLTTEKKKASQSYKQNNNYNPIVNDNEFINKDGLVEVYSAPQLLLEEDNGSPYVTNQYGLIEEGPSTPYVTSSSNYDSGYSGGYSDNYYSSGSPSYSYSTPTTTSQQTTPKKSVLDNILSGSKKVTSVANYAKNLNSVDAISGADISITKKRKSGGGGGVNLISRWATGGYTGEWGDEGKLAVLHEKELILNKKDTENILAAVQQTRDMSQLFKLIDTNATLSNTLKGLTNQSTYNSDQNVYINASFPNVNSRLEIEEAFSNLINRASQYAFNTNK